MNLDLRRVGAACGLLGPLAFLVLYVVAMSGDPDYVFFENYLSDLGVGEAAWAFNAAVIIAGSLTYPFLVLGLRPYLGAGIVAHLAIVVGMAAATFLVLVGVYTEDYDPQHYMVSVGFFMSMLVSLGLLTFELHGKDPLGRVATLATASAFAVGVVLTLMGFNPQTETVSVMVIVVWAMVIATVMLLGQARTPTP